jgi:2-polyprenyl-3-methyl-5-hydroxy-6-metoxy-1,4-benzoquinol methylase
MEKIVSKFYEEQVGQSIEVYESSHRDRFNFLIEDLKLADIKNSSILDIGCGYGPIFNRIPKENNNVYHGIDGADLVNPFGYTVADLSYDHFSSNFDNKFDFIFSFETFEHLSNPYHCLLEIKKLMHDDSIFYLSIPRESVCHNTIYPGLLYPVENFMAFLEQCAMSIVDHRVHSKSFSQNVFTLKSLDWTHSKLRWYKDEDKFRGIPPHVAINL